MPNPWNKYGVYDGHQYELDHLANYRRTLKLPDGSAQDIENMHAWLKPGFKKELAGKWLQKPHRHSGLIQFRSGADKLAGL